VVCKTAATIKQPKIFSVEPRASFSNDTFRISQTLSFYLSHCITLIGQLYCDAFMQPFGKANLEAMIMRPSGKAASGNAVSVDSRRLFYCLLSISAALLCFLLSSAVNSFDRTVNLVA